MTSTPAALRALEAEYGRLVDEHADVEPRDFTVYADDPVGFCRDVLRWDPWSKQAEVALLVRDHPQVSIRSCVSSGKDALAGALALWFAFARGGRVIVSGPTYRQVISISLAELKAHWDRAGRRALPGRFLESALMLPGERKPRIVAQVASEATRLGGQHGEKMLIIISEAADGRLGPAFESMYRSAVGADDRYLVYSQPERLDGPFFASQQRGSGWVTVKIAAADLPAFTNTEPTRPGLLTPEGAARIEHAYGGKGSPVYSYAVLAEFPATAENAITTRALLERAAALHASGSLAARQGALPWNIAVDVGRGGDPSALVWGRGYVVSKGETFSTPDGHAVAAIVRRRIADLEADGFGLGRYPVSGVVIDAIGVGSSPVDVLATGDVPLTEFKGNEKPATDPTTSRYENKRSEGYGLLAALLDRGELALERDDELWAELLALRFFINEHRGRIQMISKGDLRDVLHRSSNRADALMMYVHELETGATGGGVPVEDTYIW